MSTNTEAPGQTASKDSAAASRTRGKAWPPMVMITLGAFLLAVAGLCTFYAAGALKLAPTDTDEETVLSGTALLPANFADPANLEQAPVKVFKHDLAINATDDAVVYDSSQCLVRDEDGISGCVADDDPAGRQVNVTIDRFATDRATGMAVNDADLVGADAVPHDGLVNKFPFDVEKTTYPVWDGVLGKAVDATYQATTTVDGLEVYTFTTSAASDDAEVLPGIQGRYTDESTYFVEPRTGSIINKIDKQERFIGADQLVLSLEVAFTDDEIAQKVSDTQDSLSKLTMVSLWAPLGALVVGLPLLVGGFVLSRRRAR